MKEESPAESPASDYPCGSESNKASRMVDQIEECADAGAHRYGGAFFARPIEGDIKKGKGKMRIAKQTMKNVVKGLNAKPGLNECKTRTKCRLI
eukprot:SAG11_NODE_9987_length_864_cov_1.639216_1_plen_94_part_00